MSSTTAPPPAQRLIVLIGFMASGKSTVGRLIAQRLGLAFTDLDRAIEDRAGKSVAEIFKHEGEPGFRRREAEALAALLAGDDLVLATGGGAAAQPANLTAMLARGFVVALATEPEEVLRRIGSHSGRPLLDGAADPLGEARRLLAAREPFYRRAHATVDTVGKAPDAVATAVIAAWRARPSAQDRSRSEGEQGP